MEQKAAELLLYAQMSGKTDTMDSKVRRKATKLLMSELLCIKMKNLITVAFVATLMLGGLAGCKPHAGPSKSTGQSMGSSALAEGANTEALIHALKLNDFEMIEGKSFQQVLPSDTHYRGYEGLVALRDTTARAPNEFIVGVGPDTVMWSSSHDITGGDGIVEWKAHVQKRIALVEKLSANLSRSEEEDEKQKKPALDNP